MNKFEQNILNKCEPGTYLVTVYKNAKTSIDLSCINGHIRSVIPSNLISRGNSISCGLCTGKFRLPGKKTTEEFKEEVSIKYPYLSVLGEYKGAKEPILVGCEFEHTWEVLPSNLLSRTSDSICSICTPKTSMSKLTLAEVNTRVQKYYPYIEVLEYSNSSVEALVKDTRCNNTMYSFLGNMIQGRVWKCDICEPHIHGTSLQQKQVYEFIKKHYDGWVVENDKSMTYPKEIDINIIDLNICIEFDGMYYHQESKKGINYHLNKTNQVEEYGCRLIHIQDVEWVHKRDIVESRLLSLLGKTTKIYARKCILKEIDFPRSFLETNHIQGAGAPTSINYGLFFQEELVAIMTFSKTKKVAKELEGYELVRYCSKLQHTIVGGAGKLLGYFKKHNNGTIMSYSDKRWSQGNLYKQLGFTLHHTTAPGYAWYKNLTRLSRHKCMVSKLPLAFPKVWVEGMTEVECMEAAGYYRVFDCGNDVWVLK